MLRPLVILVAFAVTPLLAVPAAPSFEPAAAAANQLGLDLFRALAAGNSRQNLLLSPYSIETGLALAYAGAAGDTRAEMAHVLHLPDDETTLQASFAALRDTFDAALKALPSGGSTEDDDEGPAFQFALANRLYAERAYAIRAPFLAKLQQGYAASIERRDFRRFPESARTIINEWVEQQTHERIKELLPEGAVNASTRLVLVNALYLKAHWADPFSTDATRPSTFHVDDTTAPLVPTMHEKSAAFSYQRFDGFIVVVLPYAACPLQCTIILPDEHVDTATVLRALTPELLRQFRAAVPGPSTHEERKVDLFLPKFRIEPPSVSLANHLKALGLKTAFDVPAGSANFDGIHVRQPRNYLALSDVFHRTFIELDEKGTEGAAATLVPSMTLGFGTVHPPPIVVRVDRPFLFAIQHTGSGACLFLGRVVDPR